MGINRWEEKSSKAARRLPPLVLGRVELGSCLDDKEDEEEEEEEGDEGKEFSTIPSRTPPIWSILCTFSREEDDGHRVARVNRESPMLATVI